MSDQLNDDRGAYNCVDFGPNDETLIFAGGADRGYWSYPDDLKYDDLADYSELYACVYSRDGYSIFFAGQDNVGYLFTPDFAAKDNSNSNQPTDTFTNPTDDVTAAAMSYDSNFLLIGDKSGGIYIYNKICEGCPAGLYPGNVTCENCVFVMPGCASCYNHTKCW